MYYLTTATTNVRAGQKVRVSKDIMDTRVVGRVIIHKGTECTVTSTFNNSNTIRVETPMSIIHDGAGEYYSPYHYGTFIGSFLLTSDQYYIAD